MELALRRRVRASDAGTILFVADPTLCFRPSMIERGSPCCLSVTLDFESIYGLHSTLTIHLSRSASAPIIPDCFAIASGPDTPPPFLNYFFRFIAPRILLTVTPSPSPPRLIQ